MSRDIAIDVQGLGKRYEIGKNQSGYQLLTESITERVKSVGRPKRTTEFWALRDVDFQVERGETFGVIGHNGAGKSTLLKILSRITPPTEGTAHLRGRVGALLEVGTGFHPELTGRENVFLNGAILNMKRIEIQRKFDEIVEFADIGPFIDTPVKRYSSGMQLRLAFSVAAHLEPEILIIDEVLSVGDLAFQERCLGRMESASREGRTVVFISHNLPSVMNLCDRAMLLANGRVETIGKVTEVVDTYVDSVMEDIQLSLRERENRDGDGKLRFTDIQLERDGRGIDSPNTGDDFDIVVSYETGDGKPLAGVNFGINILSQGEGAPMITLDAETVGDVFREVPASGQVRCRVQRCPLPAGQYFLSLWSDVHGNLVDGVHRACDMTVAGGDFYGTGRQPPAHHRTVLVDQSWSLESAPKADREGQRGSSPERSDGTSEGKAETETAPSAGSSSALS
jgi:lipopolysaccharide transport system ATP-binding protein